jgi:hypothetical protein
MIDVTRDLERISDYLADRLSDEERDAFGERLVREPQLVREMELTLQMREGLHQLRASGYLSAPARTRARGRRWLPALAAAATLAVVALGLQVYPGLQRSTAPATAWLRASPTVGSAAVAFTFIEMRGSRRVLEVPGTGRVGLNLPVESSDLGERYQVTLFSENDGSDKPLATLSGVAAGTDGSLHLNADASHLQPGDFELVIKPSDPRVTAETFPFTVTKLGGSSAQ